MDKNRIKAVILDLGETLLTYGKIDTNKAIDHACHLSYDYLKELNQPVGSFRAYLCRNLFSIRWRCLISAITGKDFDSLAMMKKVGQDHGIKLTDDQWKQLSWLWYSAIGKLAKVETDIVHTLSKIKEMGLKLGILSNTFVHSTTLIKHLKELGLWDFFDNAIFSYNFNFRKPDKRIFLFAANEIGIAPENVLFVGDRIKADVKGSTRAGMIPVLKKAYTNLGKTAPNGTYTIENLSELPELITKHNQI